MGFVGNVVAAVVFAYLVYCMLIFYTIFFPDECIPKKGARRPSLACLRSELESVDYQTLQLRVYSSLSYQPNTFERQILRVDNFSMTDDLSWTVDVPMPPRTRNNGSMWIHAFVLPNVDVNVPALAPWHVVQTAKMTVHQMRKQQHVLLGAATADRKSGSGKEQQREDEDDPRQLSRPVTHFRSKVTLRGVGRPFAFDNRKLPMEISRLMVITERERYLPLFYLDWLTFRSDDLVPVERDVASLQLTVNYVSVSVGRLYFALSFRETLRQLKAMGFQKDDIDELVNFFGNVDLPLIMMTMMVATVHAMLDFLAFRDDVTFWRKKSSMEGMSRRALIWRVFSELVILLYLVNKRSSILVIVPVFIGILIELWKLSKAFKVTLVAKGLRLIPGLQFGTATEAESQTDQFDSEGMKYLYMLMTPICLLGALYSLVYVPHTDWYSWLLQSLANGVYLFGFVFMMPQLFVNYRLKSVAHMPWKAFMYKAFNTFIDDVFAFIFHMPIAHRLACFRDDVIFLIYLYQRWLYPVDKSRTNEYGYSYDDKKPIETISWRPSYRKQHLKDQ